MDVHRKVSRLEIDGQVSNSTLYAVQVTGPSPVQSTTY
jgi:hypothetical protein